MKASFVEALLTQLRMGSQIYLHPYLDEGVLTWSVTLEFERGGEWKQRRAAAIAPMAALGELLNEIGPFDDMEMNMGNLPDPQTWHVGTLINNLKGKKVSVADLFTDLHCGICRRERPAAELYLDTDLRFRCLTDTKHCKMPGGKTEPESEESAPAQPAPKRHAPPKRVIQRRHTTAS